MEFRILGPLEVVEDGRPIPLDRKLSRALLAYLLLHANEPVSSDRLVDELWGEGAPKTAVASLQNYVSRLRKSIGRERLRLSSAGYVLRVDPEQFDLARFDRLVDEAQSAPAKERAELLSAAIALWRGEPLEDLAFEEFAQAEIAQLSERLLNALEGRIDAGLELGRGPELVDELEGLVADHPLRERLRGQLMLALYRAGRQKDALDVYQAARHTLQEELGLEPSEELRALERRILEQDPALLTGAPSVVPIDSRRTVTILFCDVVDSTRLATTLDAEAYRQLMSSYYDAVREAVEQHGGSVEKFIGDAVLALFGVPELHEDDALRAIRAAIAARDAVDIPVRLAVNTGEVFTSVEAEGPRVTGAAVNIAAHMERRAAAGEIVLGAETFALVRDAVRAGELDLGDGLNAWRLDELVEPPPTPHFDAPLIGRKAELRKLRAAFQRARKEQACVVATVVGEPGIGKSRLGRELVASVKEDAHVLIGRCVSYGAGATFLPVAEIVRQAILDVSVETIASQLTGVDDAQEVAERVASVIGAAEAPAAPGEAFWAVRRLLEVLARERPLVVVFDDVHWAEPTLLDLVEYLGEWADAPIFVLCLAREVRPGWGGPTSTGFVVELDPLGADEVGTLVEEIGGGSVAPDVTERIVERAGGNPLFAEQLLALAAEVPDVSVEQAPPTVEALIASRLDRLGPREVDVLRRASVIGRRFTRTEIEELASEPDAELRSLERRGHLRPTHEGLRFNHVLVRDVAYRGIPKAERAELHERVATNLDRREGADEIVGYHLEQAYTYRVEVARADEHAKDLATAAGDRLGRAGIRAWKRADVPATTNLLTRAADLLSAGDAMRRRLLCELGIAVRATGQWENASNVLENAVEESVAAEDRGAELRARIELAHLHSHHHMPGDSTAVTGVIELATTAIPIFEELADDRGLGRAWLFLGATHGNFQLRFAAQEEAAQRAVHYYRLDGWSPSTCLSTLMNALYYGPRPVGEAISYSEQLLREHAGDPASEANILTWLSGLEAMIGRFDDARTHVEQAKGLYEELGLQLGAYDNCAMVLAEVETLAGRIDIAAQKLREACDACIRLSEFAYLASRAAQLADALHVLGQHDEAETWTQVSREKADVEDLHAQASWRGIASRLAARRGDLRDALQLVSEAREIVEGSDGLNQRAKLELDFAEVCRRANRETGARRAVQKAIELYDAKGNTEAASAARSLLETSALV
jgi:DNA-binding SARP family transcriptional activator